MKFLPARVPAGILPTKEQPRGIALGRVVIAGNRSGGGEIDRFAKRDRLVMQQPIDRTAGDADEWLEEDETSARREDAASFAEKRRRSHEMMEDIKQDQMRESAVAKGQLVSVAGQVEPGIRKEIGADGPGQVSLEIPDA